MVVLKDEEVEKTIEAEDSTLGISKKKKYLGTAEGRELNLRGRKFLRNTAGISLALGGLTIVGNYSGLLWLGGSVLGGIGAYVHAVKTYPAVPDKVEVEDWKGFEEELREYV